MPSIPANLDWVFFTIGGVVALGALWLLMWALFRDRARARFRCPGCWYDLRGPEGEAPALPVTCSECGRVIAKIRPLRKTRRRWRWAMVAVMLVLASGVIAYYPGAHRNGWLSIVPTWFLIDSMPVFGYPSPLTDELLRRHGYSGGRYNPMSGRTRTQSVPRLSVADQIHLADTVAHGSWGARPTSARWRSTLGQFARENRNYFFDLGFPDHAWANANSAADPALRKAISQLYALPMVVRFRTRPVWPEGHSLYIETSAEQWWPWPTGERVVVRDRRTDQWYEAINPRGFAIEGLVGKGSGEVELEVRVQWIRQAEKGSSWADRQGFGARVPYRIEKTIDQIITPVVDPAIDQLIAGSRYNGRMRADIRLPSTRTAQTRGIAFGVIVEYMLDGVIQATERAWWPGGEPVESPWESFGSVWIDGPRFPEGSKKRSPWSAQPGENWTVRIRSDPETALRVIDADKYWQGDVTVQLTIP